MCIYCLKPCPKERRFTEIKMGRNLLSGYFIHNLSLTVAVVNSESEEANLQEKCACFFFQNLWRHHFQLEWWLVHFCHVT